tara:strand:- start:314 stop:487 length:174 start_codon:yes stop_codon:yes gene_type:complete
MSKQIDPDEYMSSDILKYNCPPVTDFKRGSTYNKFGMWLMWIFYGIVIVQIINLLWK